MIVKVLWFLVLIGTWVAGQAEAGSREGKAQEKQEKVKLVTDAETVDLLRELGQPLVAAAGLPEGVVRFHVILNPELNAFALPTGEIVLHSGLVQAAVDRDELAAVMAHEIAHLSSGHHVQLKSDARNMALQTVIAAVVGMAAGVVAHDAELAQAAVMGGAAGGTATMLAAVRQKETQADRVAVRLLGQVGYDPAGLAVFMGKLEQANRFSNQPPPYLRTHPISGERVVEARDMAERGGVVKLRPDRESGRLARVRVKLEAGTAVDPGEVEARFQRQLGLGGDSFALRYGMALARRYGGRLVEAEGALTALLGEVAGDPYVLRERAMVRLEANRLPEAEADLRLALVRLPGSVDLRYQLAFVLSEEGELEEASRILYRLTSEEPREARAMYLLGMVEGRRGHVGWSHLALGRYYRLTGESGSSRWHYREAERVLPAGSPERKAAGQEIKRVGKEEEEP